MSLAPAINRQSTPWLGQAVRKLWKNLPVSLRQKAARELISRFTPQLSIAVPEILPDRRIPRVVVGLLSSASGLGQSARLAAKALQHQGFKVHGIDLTRYFYESVLTVLEVPITASGEGWLQADELFIDGADARTKPSHVHLAFQARDRQMVDAFHRAALKAGGTDNGAPGERHYHPGYYACFVLDPDGNNVEAVFHGQSTRSADAVTIMPNA